MIVKFNQTKEHNHPRDETRQHGRQLLDDLKSCLRKMFSPPSMEHNCYKFYSDENAPKWKGSLIAALQKVSPLIASAGVFLIGIQAPYSVVDSSVNLAVAVWFSVWVQITVFLVTR